MSAYDEYLEGPRDGPGSLLPTGERVSNVLTDARTVLSRARTALADLERRLAAGSTEAEHEPLYDDETGRYLGSRVYRWTDPDAEDVRRALQDVERLLAPFERTRGARRGARSRR